MRKVYFIIFFWWLPLFTFSQTSEFDISVNSRKRIKSYSIYSDKNVIQKKVEFASNQRPRIISIYTPQGKIAMQKTFLYRDTFLIQRIDHDILNNHKTTHNYLYDTNSKRLIQENVIGNKTKITISYYYKNDTLIIERDSNGDKVRELIVYEGGTSEKMQFKEVFLSNDETPDFKTIYNYDNRKLLKEIVEQENGEYYSKKVHYYDTSKRLQKIETYNQDSSLIKLCNIQYDGFEQRKECYSLVDGNKPVLESLVKVLFDKENNIVSKTELNYYDTYDFDIERLNKGSGLKYFYNQNGTQKIEVYRNGKIENVYFVKYLFDQ